MSFICNICGGQDFGPFARRKDAQCRRCYSLERTRGLYYIIRKLGLIGPNQKVLHFAPEMGLALKIKEIIGEENYFGFDLHPEIFHPEIGVKKFNILTEVMGLESDVFDLIIHSHIIEHLPCWPVEMLWHLQRSLKCTGTHLFCVPVMKGFSSADFGNIANDERARIYGQIDHFHKFGLSDINSTLGTVFNLTSETTHFAIPIEAAKNHNINPDEVSNTIFIMKKEDWKLGEHK